MAGMPWLYLIDTSPRTDFLLSLLATVGTGGVTVWAALAGGGGGGGGGVFGVPPGPPAPAR